MSKSAEVQKELIIEYWCRKLLCVSYSIQDIAKIIIEFGKEYDEFDPSLSSEDMRFADDNLTAFFSEDSHEFMLMTTGIATANPGAKYNWKIKLMEEGTEPNIGIMEAEQSDKKDTFFFSKPSGFSYYQDGNLYNVRKIGDQYGPELKKDDVVEICLDLKENYDLSFVVNEVKLAKAFDVKHHTPYKLAISMYAGKVSLISYTVKY